ncbi:MAG: hypothetical protein IKD83_01710 [Firmicutes bacterium]|nr:hypothetical protein [Bacillota bacterium]
MEFVNETAAYQGFFQENCKDRIWIDYDASQAKYKMAVDYIPRTNANSVAIGQRKTETTCEADYKNFVIGGDFHGDIVLDLTYAPDTPIENAFLINVPQFRRYRSICTHESFGLKYEDGEIQAKIYRD